MAGGVEEVRELRVGGRVSGCLVGHCEDSGSCAKANREIIAGFGAQEWPALTYVLKVSRWLMR